MEMLWDLFHRIYDVEFLVRSGGLLVLIAIVFIETGLLVGFFLPGDSLLVTAGIFAARGDLDLLTLNTTLSLAAIAGDTVGYGIGARTGPKIFTRENSLFFNRKHLISAKEFYDRYGGFTIFIARFVPIIRTFAPVVAGVGAMQFWVMSMTLTGYFLGTMIPNVQEHIHVIIAIVIVLSLLPAIIKFAQEKLRAGN
ncbi:MAG: VTT domain-containing protein [Deltaproteobacteria bacterium]|nr:VTT domain-containing protein [Deltaproteobacteria bacterium]